MSGDDASEGSRSASRRIEPGVTLEDIERNLLKQVITFLVRQPSGYRRTSRPSRGSVHRGGNERIIRDRKSLRIYVVRAEHRGRCRRHDGRLYQRVLAIGHFDYLYELSGPRLFGRC
jgi:hypothetical protein